MYLIASRSVLLESNTSKYGATEMTDNVTLHNTNFNYQFTYWMNICNYQTSVVSVFVSENMFALKVESNYSLLYVLDLKTKF